METWDLGGLDVEPHKPQILSSTEDARLIALHLPAGERLQEHEVHERAWVSVVQGEVEITTPSGEQTVSGGPGLLVEFGPKERREIVARSDARLLLVLTPWPGDGHPGAMTLEEKSRAREAAERARG